MMAAKPSKSSGQKDNFTRNLVIGMVALVVGVGVIFSVTGNQTKVSSKTPSAASEADGYGLVFNATATPVIDIWEDFQCPVCRNFEAVVGSYLSQLVREIKRKLFTTHFHLLDRSLFGLRMRPRAQLKSRNLKSSILCFIQRNLQPRTLDCGAMTI